MKSFECPYDELAHALGFSPSRDPLAPVATRMAVRILYDEALTNLRRMARRGTWWGSVNDADVLRLAMELACGGGQ